MYIAKLNEHTIHVNIVQHYASILELHIKHLTTTFVKMHEAQIQIWGHSDLSCIQGFIYHFKLETRKYIPGQTDICTVESFNVQTLDLNR